jgi:hypothetical protein
LLFVLNINIKPGTLLWIATFAVASHSFGQKYFSGRNELGWVGGVSNYHGDLAHGFDAQSYKLSGGMYYKRNLSSFFAYRLQGSYLNIQGSDAGDPNYGVRNLSFQSQVFELGNFFEFNFQPFGTNINDRTWTPYFFSGLNIFMFDPRRLENEDIKLRNLRTESQRRSYAIYQPSVPIGFGVKAISIPRKKNNGVWIFGIEGCWRKTFTDNLDDVNRNYPDYGAMVDKQGATAAQYSHAQTMNGHAPFEAGSMRGDTHLKDWYYFLGFTMAYRVHGTACAGF